MPWRYFLRATIVTALVVKATKNVVGSPLTIFVPHTIEHLLNSHHTQHFSTSFSYKDLLLIASHIIPLHCYCLNMATPPHYVTD